MYITDNEYSGKKVLIMGLGLNGGNIEAAIYLGLRGADLCITDLRDEKALAPSIEKLQSRLPGAQIRYVLGHHEIADFEKADIVIKNPGVRPDSSYLQAARHIETDLSLFLAASSSRLIAVTGSKGKSSMASAIHWILKEWSDSRENPESGRRRAFLGGNITLSPLAFLNELKEEDDVVLELSSWQLGDLKDRINEKTGGPLLKPAVAVLGTILPDHLDRYGSMEAYVADKRIIYSGQEKEDSTISDDDSWGRSFRQESRGRPLVNSSVPLPLNINGGWIDAGSACGVARLWKGCRDFDGRAGSIIKIIPKELLVPGRHQKKNLVAAGLALLDIGLPADFIMKSAASFPGIEHRLEFFHQSRGIRFYNDSAATIPEAAAAAINAFDRPPILICGGSDKNLDFAPLVTAAARAKAIVLIEGSGSAKIVPLLRSAGITYSGPFDSLEKVLQASLEKAGPGDTVVFSPGCTSFGMFLNEFDRGNQWKETVRKNCQ
ncbi:MAG: UDP-N-acetylmuramoyl-L-alanine--D-glutamate ligase [Treponema sp.]|nr:UDP-N-acetylmuramoyl-L-alanine--D-glutamate ligase [Treponema sp.]